MSFLDFERTVLLQFPSAASRALNLFTLVRPSVPRRKGRPKTRSHSHQRGHRVARRAVPRSRAPMLHVVLLMASSSWNASPVASTRRRAVLTAASALIACPSIPTLASEEPEPALRLLNLCEQRRPSDWREDERAQVDALIEEVVALKAPWPREALVGKWRLAYLQPGPDGAGVDRRVPFPELPGNDSFQIFGAESVTNVGEVFGPALEVRVSGSLAEDDPSITRSPKRFRANIDRGQLCLGGSLCAPLPISGEGIFDGVYLGKRLRIGQNLNGGGARIVQVRVE
jgi:hypothetical protein